MTFEKAYEQARIAATNCAEMNILVGEGDDVELHKDDGEAVPEKAIARIAMARNAAGYDVYDVKYLPAPVYAADDLFDEFLKSLPQEPAPIWACGDEILCATEEIAEAIANYVDTVFGDGVAHTSYYDPREDMREKGLNNQSGYYAVYLD